MEATNNTLINYVPESCSSQQSVHGHIRPILPFSYLNKQAVIWLDPNMPMWGNVQMILSAETARDPFLVFLYAALPRLPRCRYRRRLFWLDARFCVLQPKFTFFVLLLLMCHIVPRSAVDWQGRLEPDGPKLRSKGAAS
jgi:hypothetical protein